MGRIYGPHVPIAQSTWELICENQDSGTGFEVTEAILEHFKLLSLSAKQVQYQAGAHGRPLQRLHCSPSRMDRAHNHARCCGARPDTQVMSSKWTDRAIIKNALQMMESLAVPDRRTLFCAIIAVSDHRCDRGLPRALVHTDSHRDAHTAPAHSHANAPIRR
jgi:hypothetical protein